MKESLKEVIQKGEHIMWAHMCEEFATPDLMILPQNTLLLSYWPIWGNV